MLLIGLLIGIIAMVFLVASLMLHDGFGDSPERPKAAMKHAPRRRGFRWQSDFVMSECLSEGCKQLLVLCLVFVALVVAGLLLAGRI
jgi:hypothetical protein